MNIKKTKFSLLGKVLLYLLIMGIISLILMFFLHQYTIINSTSIAGLFNSLDNSTIIGGIYSAIDSLIGFGSSAISGYIAGWLTILYVLTLSTSLLILVVWVLYKICNVLGNIIGVSRL